MPPRGNKKETIRIKVDDIETLVFEIDKDTTEEQARMAAEVAYDRAKNSFSFHKNGVMNYKLTIASSNFYTKMKKDGGLSLTGDTELTLYKELLTEDQQKELESGNTVYFIKIPNKNYYSLLGEAATENLPCRTAETIQNGLDGLRSLVGSGGANQDSQKKINSTGPSYWLMVCLGPILNKNGQRTVKVEVPGGFNERENFKKAIESIPASKGLDIRSQINICNLVDDNTCKLLLKKYIPINENDLQEKYNNRLDEALKIVKAPTFTQEYRSEYYEKIKASKSIISAIHSNSLDDLSSHQDLKQFSSEQDKITVVTLTQPSVETGSDSHTLNPTSVLDAVLKKKPELLHDFAVSLEDNQNKQNFAGIVFEKVKDMQPVDQKGFFEACLDKISSSQHGLAPLFTVNSKQGCFDFNTTLAKHIQSLVSGKRPSEKSLERVHNILQAYMEGDEEKLVSALKTDRNGNQDKNTKSYQLYLLAKLKCIEDDARQENSSSSFSKAFTFAGRGCFFSKTSLVEHIRDMVNSNSDKKLKRAYGILKAYTTGEGLEKVLQTNVDGLEGKNTTSFKLFDAARKSTASSDYSNVLTAS